MSNDSQPSILRSSFRIFCHAFTVVLGIFLAFIPILIIFSSLSSDPEVGEKTHLTLLPNAEREKKIVSSSAPAILQISIHGVIGQEMLTAPLIESQLIESNMGTLKGNKVRGILLHMNTPGGGVTDSDSIYRMIKAYKERYKIPVFAYVEGLCASGGMYIAAAADKIYASPSSIIGSIGVLIGPFFNFTQIMEKVGIESRLLTQGKDKDMMNPFRPWKPGEDLPLNNIAAYLYERFVDIIVQARPNMDKQALINEYGAKVYDVEKAKAFGYIDYPSVGYVETLKELLQAANIDEKAPYRVVELQPKKLWLANFLTSSPFFTGKLKHSLQVGNKSLSNLSDPFAYLYAPELDLP